MVRPPDQNPRSTFPSETIRLGFVPLVDCAPLVIAQEMGFFEARGLRIWLQREPGWATIRDKIVFGRELDGAHALAGLAFSAALGIGSVKRACVAGLCLNTNGNAITIAKDLWTAGVRDGDSLKCFIQERRARKFCFGVVHPFSSHNFMVRAWLKRAGLVPGRDVEIIVMPPEMMSHHLGANEFAGFCVGEPWNSVAIEEGKGVCVATSRELAADHPEKVLLVSETFAREREEEHLAIIGALMDACRFCDEPDNRKEVAKILSSDRYIGVPEPLLLRSLVGPFKCGDKLAIPADDFHRFSGDDVNRPSIEKANWLVSQMRYCGLIEGNGLVPVGSIFREDIFKQATRTERERVPLEAGI